LSAHSWPGNVRELKNVVERLVVRDFGRPVQPDDLPEEVRGTVTAPSIPVPPASSLNPATHDAQPAETVPNLLWSRLQLGETFWSCVADSFRKHDVTRRDVRAVVQRGLDETHGSYRGLLKLFNLPDDDYKRVMAFLRQHECHVPFQAFRASRAIRSMSPEPLRDIRAAS
jgi:transcriptional regulator with AAA-type ATPase domain